MCENQRFFSGAISFSFGTGSFKKQSYTDLFILFTGEPIKCIAIHPDFDSNMEPYYPGDVAVILVRV